ncbi:MAG: putative mariner transposase, partial [Streblomastix strix]
LTQAQKGHRVLLAKQLLEWLNFARRSEYEFILTSDSSLVLYSYPNAGKWAPKGTPREEHERTTVASLKSMLTVIFSGKKVWLVDFLPHEIKMNSHVYIDRVLGPTMDAIEDVYPELDREVLLHIDNSPVHNSRMSRSYVKDSSLYRIEHPAYSPDFLPSDFWLFGNLNESMKGWHFQEQGQLENFVRGWLAGQSEAKLRSVFEEWRDRCHAVANSDGSYIF